MTLPSPGVSLSLQQINAEFGLGTNLGAYRGVRWYKDNAATGTFPTTDISINDFYEKRPNSPATPAGYNFYNGSPTIAGYTNTSLSYNAGTNDYRGNFTIPLYSYMTVTIRGAGGGGGGAGGAVSAGGSGGTGTASSFSSYGSAPAGTGGQGSGSTVGTAGAGSDGSPAGGAGGGGWGAGSTNGAAGGAGGKTTLVLYNPVSGNPPPYGPAVGASVQIIIGNGGTGGSGGGGFDIFGNPRNGSAGGKGGNGSVAIYIQ